MASDVENSFDLWLRTEGIVGYEREYRFSPERKWRFDYCWPARKVAVEIDGLLYGGKAGHQTVKGVLLDCEKYEAAIAAGWTVYRVPGQWVRDGKREVWRPKVMETLKILLGMQ